VSDLLWQRAAAFAARAHAGQMRADGRTPYFSHCARVAMIVASEFGCADERTLAAAFLHDTIEDTPTDYDDIERGFGKGVADCVAALTKNHALPGPVRERDYDKRLAAASWQARLIKLADAWDNWSDVGARGGKAKGIKRCKRALALVRQDAAKHAEVRRAIRLVSGALGG